MPDGDITDEELEQIDPPGTYMLIITLISNLLLINFVFYFYCGSAANLLAFINDSRIHYINIFYIDLKYITLRTIDGRAFSFQRILENKVVMVVLLRHFGW